MTETLTGLRVQLVLVVDETALDELQPAEAQVLAQRFGMVLHIEVIDREVPQHWVDVADRVSVSGYVTWDRERAADRAVLEDDDPGYPPPCSDPGGHKFECTGSAHGGDDDRWHGEGRMLCVHCGADGDA